MISIRIESKTKQGLTNKLADKYNADKIARTVALALLDAVKNRIHVDGKNSSNSPIGEYSDSYLKQREKYNRGSSSKVILSLTSQMEADFTLIALEDGKYGLGFKNDFNAEKAEWAEERYGDIYKLTPDERKLVTDVTKQLTK